MDIQVSPVRKKNVTATSSNGRTCIIPDPLRHTVRANQPTVNTAISGIPTAVIR